MKLSFKPSCHCNVTAKSLPFPIFKTSKAPTGPNPEIGLLVGFKCRTCAAPWIGAPVSELSMVRRREDTVVSIVEEPEGDGE